MLPNLSNYPLLAAILGGVFVGVGVGMIVRQGGSSGGDDALALSISHITKWPLSRSYLFTYRFFSIRAFSIIYTNNTYYIFYNNCNYLFVFN